MCSRSQPAKRNALDSAIKGDRAEPSSHSAAAMAGKADHETMPTARERATEERE